MVGELTGVGVMVVSMVELPDAITVMKVGGSHHGKDLCEHERSSDAALVVSEPLRAYEGLLTGLPRERRNGSKDARPGARWRNAVDQ